MLTRVRFELDNVRRLEQKPALTSKYCQTKLRCIPKPTAMSRRAVPGRRAHSAALRRGHVRRGGAAAVPGIVEAAIIQDAANFTGLVLGCTV